MDEVQGGQGNLKAWWFATLFVTLAFLSVFHLFASFNTRVLMLPPSHWCTQLPKCILHRKIIPAAFGYPHVADLGVPGVSYMAHGDLSWFPVSSCWPQESMATLSDSSGSNAKLPVEPSLPLASGWTISSALELCCPYNSLFFVWSHLFLASLWFQVILLAPIIDFSLVQASGANLFAFGKNMSEKSLPQKHTVF